MMMTSQVDICFGAASAFYVKLRFVRVRVIMKVMVRFRVQKG